MKLDLTKQYKAYYTAKNMPELVPIAAATFLSITGKGDPAAPEFAQNIQALYASAYTIKFACKAADQDFVVPKLEGQWWYDERKYAGISMKDSPVQIARSEWEYRMLIRMPVFVTATIADAAIEQVIAKKQLMLARAVSLFTIPAHSAVQMMHIGPFATEPETLQQMILFMETNKLQRGGLHHELYLTDFRKTPQEKLRTILREPVA